MTSSGTRARFENRSRPDGHRRPVRGSAASSVRGRRSAATRASTALSPQRRKAMRRRWVTVITVIFLGLSAYTLWFTPLLGVRSVEIVGAQGVSADRIRDAAAVPSRRPLLRVDTQAVHDRVAALLEIESVEVDRSWPSTISITVTERAPVGFFERGDGIHLVDGSGIDFKLVAEKPPGLPRLKLSRVASDDASTRAVLSVITALPAQIRGQVVAAGAVSPGSVELDLVNGKVVRWGDTTQAERKAKVLAVLLAQEGRAYDVSSPELPTVS